MLERNAFNLPNSQSKGKPRKLTIQLLKQLLKKKLFIIVSFSNVDLQNINLFIHPNWVEMGCIKMYVEHLGKTILYAPARHISVR